MSVTEALAFIGITVGVGLLLGLTLCYCIFKIFHPGGSFRDFLRSFE